MIIIVMIQTTMRDVNGMEEIAVETMWIQHTVKFVHVLIQEQEVQEVQEQQCQVVPL